MTEQAVNNYEDDEISLLDILVTLAESWKLLVFGPLIAGVLVGGGSFLLPKTFESVTIVRLSEPELALLSSTPVLDQLVERFGLLAEFDGVREDAHKYLATKVVGKFEKKTNLAFITATASSPERAQEMGNAAMDSLLKELLPKGKNKKQIEQKIISNEMVISSNKDALDQLHKQMGKSGGRDADLESAMKYYATLTNDIALKELENLELRNMLLIKGDEVYVQRANLPHWKTTPKRSLLVQLTVVVSGFVLLVFVFIRKAWLSLANDVKSASKIAAIKRALGL